MNSPQTEVELLTAVTQLSGATLEHVANSAGIAVPESLLSNKGWIGQLLETVLGADAGVESLPDFTALNIELKTIPISPAGKPLESTFVCMVSLMDLSAQTWQTSMVRRKLARVLWVPILSVPNLALKDRRIGRAVLWSPSAEQEAILQQDWQELTEILLLGQYEQISAKMGTALQIRPKAQDRDALCWGVSEEGERVLTLPRGFYLRSCFTESLLQTNDHPQG